MYIIAVSPEGDEFMNRLFMIFRLIRKDIVVMLFALINRAGYIGGAAPAVASGGVGGL